MSFASLKTLAIEGTLSEIDQKIGEFLYNNRGCDNYHFSITTKGKNLINELVYTAVVVVTFADDVRFTE